MGKLTKTRKKTSVNFNRNKTQNVLIFNLLTPPVNVGLTKKYKKIHSNINKNKTRNTNNINHQHRHQKREKKMKILTKTRHKKS